MSNLNFNFLRWKSSIRNFNAQGEFLFSRRGFLGGAAAVLGGSPEPAIAQSRQSLIEFRHAGGRAAFYLDGVERWVFEPTAFSGNPRLDVTGSIPDEFTVALRGGRYPGTLVPIDIEVKARCWEGTWECAISTTPGQKPRRVDLVQWLEGQPLELDRSLRGPILSGGTPVQITAKGYPRVSLDSRWRLAAAGRFRIALEGSKAPLSAGAISLIPAAYSDNTRLALHRGPASEFTAHSGLKPWDASVSPLLRSKVIEIPSGERLFDRLQIDTWEPAARGPRTAFSFSQSDEESIDGLLHGDLRTINDERVSLPLVRATYSLAAEGALREQAFFASLQRPVTAYASSHAIVFDGQIAIQQTAGPGARVSATVGASKFYVNHYEQPDGTIFEFEVPDDYQLPALHLGHHVGLIERGWDAIVEFLVSNFTSNQFEAPLDGVKIRLSRPLDMLHLEFALDGLLLKMHAGLPYLKRRTLPDGTQMNAALTVTFVPQSLQENAFGEDATGDPDPPGTPPIAPVVTSSSGCTTMRFRLDPDLFDDDLPFTTKTLLDWNRYTFIPGNRRRPYNGSQIEVPYRLFLNPAAGFAFQHDVVARTSVEVTTGDPEKSMQVRAPELWSTLLHAGENDVAHGADLSPMEMTAFDAADIAELIMVQAIDRTTVRATLNRPLPLRPNDQVTLLRGANISTYASIPNDPAISILRVFAGPDGSPLIDYTFAGANLTPEATPVVPNPPLWLVPFPHLQHGQLGGVPTPAMDGLDRGQVVAITTAGTTPLNVNRLTLTALGAWFDADSKFSDESVLALDLNMNLRAWRHITVLGRDSFVQIKYAGFLWPFGHKAQFIKRTERVFFSVKAINIGCDKTKVFCYLRQQFFVELKEKSKSYYDGNANPLSASWDLPFTRIEINTKITPALSNASSLSTAFIPQYKGNDLNVVNFPFDVTGYDWAKPPSSIAFKAPLVFVFSDENMRVDNAMARKPIVDLYASINQVSFNDQHIHFAPSKAPGDTEHQVDTINFQGKILPSMDQHGRVNFYPFMSAASVKIPAVQKLTGVVQQSTVDYEPDNYTPKGFPNGGDPTNPSEIYLRINSGTNLSFPGNHSGGVVKPTIPLNSVNRPKGAISFNRQQTLNPTAYAFFPPIVGDFPKLFGVIPLQDLLFDSDLPQTLPPFTNDCIPSTLTNLIDGAMVLCQQIQQYRNDIQQILEFANLVQSLRTEAVNQLKRAFAMAQTMLKAAVKGQVDMALNSVKSSLDSAEMRMLQSAAQITGFNQAQVRMACDSLQINLAGTLETFDAAVQGQLDTALMTFAGQAFQAEQTLNDIHQMVLNLEEAPDQIVGQIQALESRAAIFTPLLGKSGTDLSGAVTVLLSQQLQMELAANGDVVDQLTTSLGAPLVQFEDSFAQATDAALTLYSYTWDQAVGALSNPTQQALGILAAARATYIQTLTETTSLVNARIADAQTQIATVVADAVTAAAATIVQNAVAAVGDVINNDLDAITCVLNAIAELNTYAGKLKEILNTPISYGMKYDLPKIPLKSSLIFINHTVEVEQSYLTVQTSINAYTTPDKVIGGNPQPKIDYQVNASITDFGIGLFSGDSCDSFISVFCRELTVTTRNQEHPQVHFQLAPTPMTFGADMDYIKGLISAFSSLGSGNSGPLIELSCDGIDLAWGFGIPDIKAGGFRITGVAFSFGVHLSFSDDPLQLVFYFARPEKHFTISAGIYGGGGYTMLRGGPSPSSPGQQARAAITAFGVCVEFGATTALSLVAASGEAHIMAGTYIGQDHDVLTLTGFVRAGGSLSVIGIITMSLEIYIGVSYAKPSVQGTGSVTVSISICFFSIDVTVSMSWTWGGGGSESNAVKVLKSAGAPDPPERMKFLSREQWNTYAKAF